MEHVTELHWASKSITHKHVSNYSYNYQFKIIQDKKMQTFPITDSSFPLCSDKQPGIFNEKAAGEVNVDTLKP